MMTQSELFLVRMMTPIMESVTPGEILNSNLNTFSTTSIVITPQSTPNISSLDYGGEGGFFARKIKDIDQDLQKFDVSVTEIPKMVSMNIESLTPRVFAKTQGNHVTTQGKALATSALYLKSTSHN